MDVSIADQRGLPSLYRPEFEHDACGIGCITQIDGTPSHGVIADALKMLINMEHRGACGCDPNTGDGAGILIQLPHAFLSEVCLEEGIHLPAPGAYGVGMVFFPNDAVAIRQCKEVIATFCEKLGLRILGYRKVPSFPQQAHVGADALQVQPHIEQLFVSPVAPLAPAAFERKLYVARRAIGHYLEREVHSDFYFTSFSHKTIVYKGQFTTEQVGPFYGDLRDERVVSALAVVHSRFSTNTVPRWRLAQPFRYIAHNGEINTLTGNVNWMLAKQAILESALFSKEEMDLLLPICEPTLSDSRNLDAVVELLVMAGRELPHVMMMLMPEAWQDNPQIGQDLRNFYEYHAALVEPWDGPAAVVFTDGKLLGVTLDRNGLRPARYVITHDGRFILASEAGALPLPPEAVKERGRLKPGKMVVVDTTAQTLRYDEEIKQGYSRRQPYGEWLAVNKIQLEDLPVGPQEPSGSISLVQQQLYFGITAEELKVVLGPMGKDGKEALGSMGSDTPLAVLSQHSQHISHYFKQLFAQVSNPPIDPIRERSVMSLRSWIGGSRNFLEETALHCEHIATKGPVLTDEELSRLRHIDHPAFKAATLQMVYRQEEGLEQGIKQMCQKAQALLSVGVNILIVSDRASDEDHLPIPALMAVGAVHHELIRQKQRHLTALIVETGDAREVHHIATLIGFGAVAVNPYLAFASLRNMCETRADFEGYASDQVIRNYRKSIHKGLLKICSKMGISTIQSYHGAQIFEILGLSKRVVDTCFRGAISRIEGLDFEGIHQEILARYKVAFPTRKADRLRLEEGGLYQWKQNGEVHLFNPETIHLLQHATRRNDYKIYKRYAQAINKQGEKAVTLRSLLEFTNQQPIPIEEVESVESLFKRFATGAMSFGSISHEAHSLLAIAMNRIGGKSNSGEGGEDPKRYERSVDGDSERSAIKQVASGRFGVTAEYLSQAEELQIKIAQGAKPGEGGHLPGHKVDDWIGRVRHATPGVGLISPPPHHDIYSIEDLAQLIFDLKNANRHARISVKLVSKAGVGTIASGVAKAHADHILISGFDGGTGASPLSSIRHAGLPWELGLAETHQTLVKNKLRSRVTLQVDGQIKTGRDMAIATLLGAEEWGVATAALVVEGCIMMRKCHLNTCPVGIATQNPVLRERFDGKVEHLIAFFTFLAEEMREYMAELGFRTVEEMVGQVDRLKVRENLSFWKHQALDLSEILYKAPPQAGVGLYKSETQAHGLDVQLDWQLMKGAENSLTKGEGTTQHLPIRNIDRTVGTMLSHAITQQYGPSGLPEGTVEVAFNGSAGQSFGAFTTKGMKMILEGEGNDYFGKGLSGATLIVYPNKAATQFQPGQNIIIGNVALYGATSGEVFIRGIAGERFAVRNSGAMAVVEGVGDHGCEYMTGGRVVVLGSTGRNFAAGMSGGIAYVYDPHKTFIPNVNQELIEFDALLPADVEMIKSLVSKHHQYTGSRIAMKLITDWESAFDHFVKVIPTDYKRILAERDGQLGEQLKLG